MKSVAVFGAGGRVGRLLVPALSAVGHDVTAVVRDPLAHPRLPEARTGPGRVRVRAGDVRDGLSVRSILPGHDTVVSVVGPPGRKSQLLYSRAAEAIVPSMEKAGVERLVVLSSAGVFRDDPAFATWYRLIARTLLRELYRDMSRMEAVIRRSSLEWTVVRPTRITDGPGTRAYRVGDGATPPGGNTIPASDLVDFIVAEITQAPWKRACPTLAT